MCFLYLDDSGKIHPNDSSKVFVLGGFSVDEDRWHKVVRQVSGAKKLYFPKRIPQEWEIKGEDFLTPNDWKRAVRRDLCYALSNVLQRNDCRVYIGSLEKANANDVLDEKKYFGLTFQRLVGKFHAEITKFNTTGTIICN
jgi:hypothetical protein